MLLARKEGTHDCATTISAATTFRFLRRGRVCGGRSLVDRHCYGGDDGGRVCAACFEDVFGGHE
jgi:hypothetical protein